MNANLCRSEFEKLAQRLGIEIQYVPGVPSGLCTVKGKRVLYIDRNLDPRDRIDIFVREFKALDLEGIFVVPLIRKLLGMEDADETW